MKTLAYHAGALGDFLAIVPLLAEWKSRHKNSRIVLLGKRVHARLLQPMGLVNEVWDVDSARWTALFRLAVAGENASAAILNQFDAAIIFAGADSALAGNVRAAEISLVLQQQPFPDRQMHICDYHLSLLDPEEAAGEGRHPQIMPSQQARSHAASLVPLSSTLAVVHPGSGSALKNWPLERFACLTQKLSDSGLSPVWLVGPAEENMPAPRGVRGLTSPPLDTCAAILESAGLFVGNDSGMAHLAAAVGCPTVVIFGPSDPTVWVPLGDHVTVVEAPCACRPCHPHTGAAPACDRSCLLSISEAQVLDVCLRSWQGDRPRHEDARGT